MKNKETSEIFGKRVEIIVHRSQSRGQSIVSVLDHLYCKGLRSFEIDVVFQGKVGLCVGRPGEQCVDPIVKVLGWIESHIDVYMYWDLKYPFEWDIPLENVRALFRRISPVVRQRIYLISYDYAFLKKFAGVIKYGQICNEFHDCEDASLLVIPYEETYEYAVELQSIVKQGREVVVSNVVTKAQMSRLVKQGIERVMTDHPLNLLYRSTGGKIMNRIEIRIPGSGMGGVMRRCARGEIVDYRSDIDGIVDRLCYVNFRQWNLEDIARSPDLSPEGGLEVLRKIQESNAERVSLINQIDNYYLAAEPPSQGKQMYWCHTFGEMIDSLSILYIREFKFQQLVLGIEGKDSQYATEALSSVTRQISVCEKAYLQNLQLFVQGRLRYLPYKRYKLYAYSTRSHENE